MRGATSSKRELIRSGTKVDDIVRTIADDIVTGALRPGTKLDEITLALRFEVSRTPVREGLRQLTAMGLVDRQPNRGAVVAVMSQQHLFSMFESMAELEAVCARFAAERMTTAERHALDMGHRASALLVRRGEEEAYEAHNIDFHSRLYAGSHSPHVEELAQMTRSRLAPFRRAQFRLAGRLAKSWSEHDAIVSAILRGDAHAAGTHAQNHVSIVSEASAIFASSDTVRVRDDSSGHHRGGQRR